MDVLVTVACAMLWAQGASAALMAAAGVPGPAVARFSVGFAMMAAPFAASTLCALSLAAALGVRPGRAGVLLAGAVAGGAYVPYVLPYHGRMGGFDAAAAVLCVGIPLGTACAATCVALHAVGVISPGRRRRGGVTPRPIAG